MDTIFSSPFPLGGLASKCYVTQLKRSLELCYIMKILLFNKKLWD